MRDPTTRIDPEVEAAIEETRAFLERDVSADSGGQTTIRDDATLLYATLDRGSSLRKWAKDRVREPLSKRCGNAKPKPTLRYRDVSIAMAARRLHKRGYH